MAGNIVKFFREAFQKLIDIIPEPIKKLLGGLELPKLNLDIGVPKLSNPFKALKESKYKSDFTEYLNRVHLVGLHEKTKEEVIRIGNMNQNQREDYL